jgi:hypothetical protein
MTYRRERLIPEISILIHKVAEYTVEHVTQMVCWKFNEKKEVMIFYFVYESDKRRHKRHTDGSNFDSCFFKLKLRKNECIGMYAAKNKDK